MCIYLFVSRESQVPAGSGGGENLQDETDAGEDQEGFSWCQETGLWRVFVCVSLLLHLIKTLLCNYGCDCAGDFEVWIINYM